jgi:hypothetical protein
VQQPLAIPADPGFAVNALASMGSGVYIGGRFSHLSNQQVVANLARIAEPGGPPSGLGGLGVNAQVLALRRILLLRIGGQG